MPAKGGERDYKALLWELVVGQTEVDNLVQVVPYCGTDGNKSVLLAIRRRNTAWTAAQNALVKQGDVKE